VPSRRDLFNAIRNIALAAGAATVIRGYWYPGIGNFVGSAFPVVNIIEERENITAHQQAYSCSGLFRLWIWMETGSPSTDAQGGGENRYQLMDDYHDAILREFEQSFPVYTSNTTSVYPESFDIFYWYEPEDAAVNVIGAELSVRYNLNFA
jgi:hypothetical protein